MDRHYIAGGLAYIDTVFYQIINALGIKSCSKPLNIASKNVFLRRAKISTKDYNYPLLDLVEPVFSGFSNQFGYTIKLIHSNFRKESS